MLAGIALFAAGLTIRAGAFATSAIGPTVSPTSGPGAVIPASSPTPPMSPSGPVGASPPVASAEAPGPTPPALGEILFADDFATAAAWPTGPIVGATARYEDGAYVLDTHPIDLPSYVLPAAGDGPLPETLTVSATFELGGPDARAGLVVRDVAGTTVGALLSIDGRVILIRDSFESFDVLGTGSADAGDGPIRVSISVGPDGTSVMLDSRVVVLMEERIAPVAFGIAIWSQHEPATIVVDHYEVQAAPGS